MSNLNDVLARVSRNKKITVRRIGDNDIQILIGDRLPDILRIYPQTKTAEFLDIEEDWEELEGAVKEIYKDFPEIKILYNYLCENDYDIIF